jgi:hypothetical protein
VALGGGMVNEASPPRSRTNVTISGRSAQWYLAEISVIAHSAATSSRTFGSPTVRSDRFERFVRVRTRASGAPFRSGDLSGLGLLATAIIKGRVADFACGREYTRDISISSCRRQIGETHCPHDVSHLDSVHGFSQQAAQTRKRRAIELPQSLTDSYRRWKRDRK